MECGIILKSVSKVMSLFCRCSIFSVLDPWNFIFLIAKWLMTYNAWLFINSNKNMEKACVKKIGFFNIKKIFDRVFIQKGIILFALKRRFQKCKLYGWTSNLPWKKLFIIRGNMIQTGVAIISNISNILHVLYCDTFSFYKQLYFWVEARSYLSYP